MTDWPEVLVQVIDERNGSRDVEGDDLVLAHVVKELDKSPEGVAVGGDDNLLALPDGWDDLVVPERKHSVDGGGEALIQWKDGWVEVLVPWVLAWIVLGVLVEWWWWDGEGTPPLGDLVNAVLLGGLSLVEALESTIVALVKTPGADDWDPHLVHLVKGEPESADGTLKDGSEGNVEVEALSLQDLTGRLRLLDTLWGEVAVVPAGEAVLEVPLGLSVAEKNDLVFRGG